jgi:hypothetical protein
VVRDLGEAAGLARRGSRSRTLSASSSRATSTPRSPSARVRPGSPTRSSSTRSRGQSSTTSSPSSRPSIGARESPRPGVRCSGPVTARSTS